MQTQTISGQIQFKEVRDGTSSSGRPWQKVKYTLDGKYFGSFDTRHFDFNEQDFVTISFQERNGFRDILDIQKTEKRPPIVAEKIDIRQQKIVLIESQDKREWQEAVNNFFSEGHSIVSCKTIINDVPFSGHIITKIRTVINYKL